MSKISVIVPVYNTGQLLRRCITSILNQSHYEMEILLINDGSTDESAKICDEFAILDNRVQVIHKKNEGVSIARNTGLALAQGEYIGFVDSDDWVEPEMYKILLERANKFGADVVMCDATTVYSNGSLEKDTIFSLETSCRLCKENLTAENLVELAGSAWKGIYKKELLRKYNIFFERELPLSEDRIFNLRVLGHGKVLYYEKSEYYNRYVRRGSAVSRYYPDILNITNKYRGKVLELLEKLWANEEQYKNVYNKQFVRLYLSAVYNYGHRDCKLSYVNKRKHIGNVVDCKEFKETMRDAICLNWQEKIMKNRQITLLLFLGRMFHIRQEMKK